MAYAIHKLTVNIKKLCMLNYFIQEYLNLTPKALSKENAFTATK